MQMKLWVLIAARRTVCLAQDAGAGYIFLQLLCSAARERERGR
ncbi:hypothetical protein A2U01_0072917, partial [Trifolium medium]|nr:hypothetical protein [Trifolium medium]